MFKRRGRQNRHASFPSDSWSQCTRCTRVRWVQQCSKYLKNKIEANFAMLLLASRMAALGSRRALTTLMPAAGHAAATASTITSASNCAYNLPSRSSFPSSPYFSPSHWQQRRWMASSADLDRFDAHAQQLAAVIDAASESMVIRTSSSHSPQRC